MAKKVYIGINTQVPVYEESNNPLNTGTLLQEKFSFNGLGNADEEFSLNSTNGIFQSNNNGAYEENEYIDEETGETVQKEEGIDSWMQWTALTDITDLYFDWKVSSEAECDILTIYNNDKTYIEASGEQSGTIGPINLAAGDYLEFLYYKNSSTDEGEDTATISNVRCYSKIYTGTTMAERARQVNNIYLGIDNIARSIVKAYIGIGGVARPFWPPVASFYGNLDPLPTYINDAQGVTFNNQAIFFGGSSSENDSTNAATQQTEIFSYDNSLTRTTVGTASHTYSRDAAASNKYIMYATSLTAGELDFYILNTDFTSSTIEHPNGNAYSAVGVGALGDYLFAAGGIRHVTSTSRYYSEMVCSWNADLTCILSTNGLSQAVSGPTLPNNDTYIFIGGGSDNYQTDDNDSPYVVAYDTNLTKQTAADLSRARYGIGKTTFNNLAIFAGGNSTELRETTNGYYTAQTQEIDIYNNAMTHTSCLMQYERGSCAPVGLSRNLIVRGGHSHAYTIEGTTAEILDSHFVNTLLTGISQDSIVNQGYARTGQYAIYFCGRRYDSNGEDGGQTNAVEAFKD